MKSIAQEHDCLLIDLDGTVFCGRQPTGGAVQSLSQVRSRKLFVTNNASRSADEVAAHLCELGFTATGEDVVTSAQSAAHLLAGQLAPGARVLIVGTEALANEVAAVGLRPVRRFEDRPDAVVQGLSMTTGWSDLAEAALAIRAGALWVACALVIAERVGKAVRGPAKDTLLSHAASVTGRGRGFAVHEALDQVGAMIGPLTVAGMLAITGNAYAPALGVLTLPGGAALALLLWLQRRVPRPESYEDCPVVLGNPSAPRPWALPAQFWLYCGFTAITMLGFGTFGLLSFHMVSHGVLAAAMVPVVYAAAMAADALTALASGFSYDRYGAKTLAVLPILSILVVLFAFTDNVTMVVIGTLVWGAAVGIQESTLRGVVADLVASPRRASAYGVFAAGLGAATAGGGALIGWLYDISIGTLVVVVIALELMALVMMFAIRLPRVAPS
ncbi:MFS transporter [Mycobacterium tuberculosis]|nr:MFS transporter [Mycobacterium tuberculosis]